MPTQLVRLCLGVSLALVTSLPGTSSASSIASTFKSSSNGTTTLAVSDTIQFEVSITLDAGQAFDTVFFSVTGDVVGAIGSSPASGWAGVQNIVTDWEWHYSAGNKVDMGTNGVLVPFPPPFSPPILTDKVPSAEAVGTLACEDCHNVEPDFYRDGPHKLAFFRDGVNAGCESCHGAGSVHADYFYENDDYEDEPHDLVSSDDLRKLTEPQRSSLCQQCHQQDFPLWPTTDHARAEVGCWSCHPADLHTPQPGAVEISPVVGGQSDNDFCVQCHEAVAPEFALQFHHRVPEGQMKCADCHSIHGEAKINSIVQGESAACLSCHSEIQGPFVYEHVGLEEGCSSCHEPHGSVNNKLLTTNDNSLCLQCHYQELASQFGREPHGGLLRGGALCYDCHTHVHGSNTDRNFNPRRNE